jgi:hypothetical protein
MAPGTCSPTTPRCPPRQALAADRHLEAIGAALRVCAPDARRVRGGRQSTPRIVRAVQRVKAGPLRVGGQVAPGPVRRRGRTGASVGAPTPRPRCSGRPRLRPFYGAGPGSILTRLYGPSRATANPRHVVRETAGHRPRFSDIGALPGSLLVHLPVSPECADREVYDPPNSAHTVSTSRGSTFRLLATSGEREGGRPPRSGVSRLPHDPAPLSL